MRVREYQVKDIASIIFIMLMLASFALPSEVLGFSYFLTNEQIEEAKNYGKEHGLYPLIPEESPLEVEKITKELVEKVRWERFKNLWKWTKEEWVVPGVHHELLFCSFDENLQKDSYLLEPSLAIVVTPFLLTAVIGSIAVEYPEIPIEPESAEKAILMQDVVKQKAKEILLLTMLDYLPIIVWTQEEFREFWKEPEFVLRQGDMDIEPVFIGERWSSVEKEKGKISYTDYTEEWLKGFSETKPLGPPPHAVGKFYYLLFRRETGEYTIDPSKLATLIVKIEDQEKIAFVLDFENMR